MIKGSQTSMKYVMLLCTSSFTATFFNCLQASDQEQLYPFIEKCKKKFQGEMNKYKSTEIQHVLCVASNASYMTLAVVFYTVADPGFPRGKGANPEGGGANLLFCSISPKNCMKMKKKNGPGSVSLVPPWIHQ